MAQAFLILVYLFIYFLEVLEFCTVWGNGNDDYQKFIFKDSFKRTNRKLDAFFAVFFRLFYFRSAQVPNASLGHGQTSLPATLDLRICRLSSN